MLRSSKIHLLRQSDGWRIHERVAKGRDLAAGDRTVQTAEAKSASLPYVGASFVCVARPRAVIGELGLGPAGMLPPCLGRIWSERRVNAPVPERK